jgi:hypothetical protein
MTAPIPSIQSGYILGLFPETPDHRSQNLRKFRFGFSRDVSERLEVRSASFLDSWMAMAATMMAEAMAAEPITFSKIISTCASMSIRGAA